LAVFVACMWRNTHPGASDFLYGMATCPRPRPATRRRTGWWNYPEFRDDFHFNFYVLELVIVGSFSVESVTPTDVTRELTLLCQDESKDIFVEAVSAELYLFPLFRQYLCLYGGKDEWGSVACWVVCGGGGGFGVNEKWCWSRFQAFAVVWVINFSVFWLLSSVLFLSRRFGTLIVAIFRVDENWC
jgi:hypothetical protein